jgi:hypothetical protein
VAVVEEDPLGPDTAPAGLDREVVDRMERLDLRREAEDEVEEVRNPHPLLASRAMSGARPRMVAGLEVNEADDGLVVYDPATDMVHHLNASASLIFELCDGSRDPDAIARILGEAYGLSTPPSDEALAGLRDLDERGLIAWPRSAA